MSDLEVGAPFQGAATRTSVEAGDFLLEQAIPFAGWYHAVKKAAQYEPVQADRLFGSAQFIADLFLEGHVNTKAFDHFKRLAKETVDKLEGVGNEETGKKTEGTPAIISMSFYPHFLAEFMGRNINSQGFSTLTSQERAILNAAVNDGVSVLDMNRAP